MLTFDRILKIIGGVLLWMLLLSAGFGAGMGVAHLLHLILD